MNTLSLLSIAFRIVLGLAKIVAGFQIQAAERRGEQAGEAREFLLWVETLDERVAKAEAAGDDVASGRVLIDPANDPFNRAGHEQDSGDKPT